MGISVDWLDEQESILIFQIENRWSVDDLYKAVKYGYEMSQDKPSFSIIYDVTNSRGIPHNYFSASQYLRQMKQDNVKLRVIVGANSLIVMMKRIFDRTMPEVTAGIEFADTLDEAVKLIGVHDQKSQRD